MSATLRTVGLIGGFAQLADIPCRKVSILNTSGGDLTIQMNGDRGAEDTHVITLPDGKSVCIPVVANASEIRVNGASGSIQLVME